MKKVIIQMAVTETGGVNGYVRTEANPQTVYRTKIFASAKNAEHDAKCWITDNLGDPEVVIKWLTQQPKNGGDR